MLKGLKAYKFYEQVKQEVHKVIWPEKKELLTSTGVVLLVVLVFSVLCLFLDYGIHAVIQALLRLGK
jgi:preprotein translocase subunit SecE